MSIKTVTDLEDSLHENESGRITILVLGLAILVIALVLTSAAATTIQVQRRHLLACADAISLSVVGVSSAQDYYQGSDDTFAQANINSHASRVFNQLQDTTCDVGTRRNITDVAVKNNAAVVQMSMSPKLPVVGNVLDFINQPITISVASSAKMH